MKDQLPKKIHKQESGIINMDDSDGCGTNWTAYKKHGYYINYFDSFGNLSPPIQLVEYFNSNGLCNIMYNHDPYQSYDSVNCGHLCLSFLYNN